MGLSEMPEQMSYYPTLTREEMARMHPCRRAKCVMMSADSSPTLQASASSTHYPELPDEPRPGKIRPSTPSASSITTNSSPSPRASSLGNGSSSHHHHHHQQQQQQQQHHNNNNSNDNNNSRSAAGSSGADSPEVEAIEEAVPIVRTTLPSPEPRPTIERNGFKEHSSDKLVPKTATGLSDDKVDGSIKFKPPHRDIDEDSCVIKCVYFTQQCCECTII